MSSASTYDRESLSGKFQNVAMSFGFPDLAPLPDIDALDLSAEQKVRGDLRAGSSVCTGLRLGVAVVAP